LNKARHQIDAVVPGDNFARQLHDMFAGDLRESARIALVGVLAVIASPRIVVQWNIFAGCRYLLPTSAVKNF